VEAEDLAEVKARIMLENQPTLQMQEALTAEYVFYGLEQLDNSQQLV